MRAAILTAVGGKLELRDDVTADPPRAGEVRVRIRAAGVCHSDRAAQEGLWPQPVPAVLGHEGAGEVIELGEGVDDLGQGDRVIVNWLPSCGECPACLRREPHLCIAYVLTAAVRPRFRVGDTRIYAMAGCGVFAEEIVVPRAGVFKIDDDVPYEVAALIGCGVMTGVGAVINTAALEPGARVAVIGCGGVGIAAIQAARIAGASSIVAVDTQPSKHDTALRFGATEAALPREMGDDFDCVFEVVGLPETIRKAWEATRRGGKVVVVGAGAADRKVEFTAFELMFDAKALLGSFYGSANVTRDYPLVLDWWRSGKLDLTGMITHRLGLEDVNEALAALGRGDVIRQVVRH